MEQQIGLFRLVDPPAGMAKLFAKVRAAINFPWARLLPAIRLDPDQLVVVRWTDTGQQTSGKFFAGTYEIHLSTTSYHQNPGDIAHTLAHEIGHLVDRATLGPNEKAYLTRLFHEGEFIQLGHLHHDHPDAGHESEAWRSSDNYISRLDECYADQFVAAFAPTVWDGSLMGESPHYPRFLHWTDDHEAIRRITLERKIMAFTDVPESHPHREGIEWAAGEGLVSGYPDGTFKPENPVTRAQLSTILHRQAQQEE